MGAPTDRGGADDIVMIARWWSALVLLAPLVGAAGDASAQASRRVVRFSRPGERTLIVEMSYATIVVIGVDRDDVVFVTERDTSVVLARPPDAPPRVPAVMPLRIVVVDNWIRVLAARNTIPTVLRIEVPRRTSLVLTGSNGGPITVRGVTGTIEVINSNAGVTLEDISGAAVVHTSNGNLIVSFVEVDPGRPMSFITSNGVLDVTLPEGVAADIVMETDNGDFFSDFTITPLDAPDAARWSQVLAGSINGGGVVYRFRTDNANIFLRRR